MKCGLCGEEIVGYGNNGSPLTEEKVCDSCNWEVIQERLKRSKAANDRDLSVTKSASEGITLGELDGVVVGGGGPVNVTDPIKDFEDYAKQFEDTFILGKTPIRKEKAENKVKVKDGSIEGEVVSLEKKEEKMKQVDPTKSATEALHGFSEIYEFFKLCKALGINDNKWLQRFVDENPGDPLQKLREYASKELGEGWNNKDLTDEDKKELKDLSSREFEARLANIL